MNTLSASTAAAAGATANAGGPAPAPGTAAQRFTAAAARRWVTDAPTRMFHALFAVSFALAWITGDSEQWRALHVTLGYTMAGLLAFRVVYGFVGPRPARWSSLARRLAGWPSWLRTVTAGLRRGGTAVPWRQGQNLLMAAAMAALMLLLAPLALSGYATYAEWGGRIGSSAGEWLEEVHEAFANVMLALVLLHVGLIALMSIVRRQNQARPMLSGRVPGAGRTWCRHSGGGSPARCWWRCSPRCLAVERVAERAAAAAFGRRRRVRRIGCGLCRRIGRLAGRRTGRRLTNPARGFTAAPAIVTIVTIPGR
ncbi:MAG: cytochrome b/b6 domain-containing protein [Rubrivivax sp.]